MPNIRNRAMTPVLVFLLGIIGAVWPEDAAAAEVKIVNKNGAAMTLSDLIVFGDKGKKEIILHRSFAIDDVTIAAGATETFTTSFEVIAIASSIVKNGKESEYVIKELPKNPGPHRMGWLENAVDGTELFPSIDSEFGVGSPAAGSVLNFTAGLSPQLSGWFVGTSLDLDQGIVLDGFTGSAVVVLSDVELSVVPEPTSLVLLCAALLLLLRSRTRFLIMEG